MFRLLHEKWVDKNSRFLAMTKNIILRQYVTYTDWITEEDMRQGELIL